MTTWKEDIVKALKNLGGSAHLSEIYNEVERIRPDKLNQLGIEQFRENLKQIHQTLMHFQEKRIYFIWLKEKDKEFGVFEILMME